MRKETQTARRKELGARLLNANSKTKMRVQVTSTNHPIYRMQSVDEQLTHHICKFVVVVVCAL